MIEGGRALGRIILPGLWMSDGEAEWMQSLGQMATSAIIME